MISSVYLHGVGREGSPVRPPEEGGRPGEHRPLSIHVYIQYTYTLVRMRTASVLQDALQSISGDMVCYCSAPLQIHAAVSVPFTAAHSPTSTRLDPIPIPGPTWPVPGSIWGSTLSYQLGLNRVGLTLFHLTLLPFHSRIIRHHRGCHDCRGPATLVV